MDTIICVFFITILQCVWQCDGVSIREQLEHIALRRRESQGHFLPSILRRESKDGPVPYFLSSRRRYDFQPLKNSVILGAPSMVSHLPEAEPILPGHTLLRPALDMLKSSIKFPHRDMDDGAGVYGNIDNLSIRWDGRNDRVLYTGYRKMNERDGTMAGPEPSTINGAEDGRYDNLLVALLRKNRGKKKRVRQRKPKLYNGLYQSVYPYKGQKPEVIKVSPAIKNKRLYKLIMDKIRKEVKTNSNNNNKKQSGYFRKRIVKKRPRPRATYAYINLDNIDQVLRASPPSENNSKERGIVLLHNSEDISSDTSDVHEESSNEENGRPNLNDNMEYDPKLTWFWNSKDTFNHIKISPEAPDFHELFPVVHTNDTKNWWFYHAADFEPFEKD